MNEDKKRIREILEKEVKGLNLSPRDKLCLHMFSYYDAEDMMEKLLKKEKIKPKRKKKRLEREWNIGNLLKGSK